jgi:hypothetical protein
MRFHTEQCEVSSVSNNFGEIVLNVYLACVMGWMVVMLLVAIAHLL